MDRAVLDLCLVEVAAVLGVTNGHRRRRSSTLEAKRTFERLQQADVDHRRRCVFDIMTGICHHGNEHLQLQPYE